LFKNSSSVYIGWRNRFLGLLKHLQIQAQATLASGIGYLEWSPRIHNMKNEDELWSSSFFLLRSCLFLKAEFALLRTFKFVE
jgi:hypothetical protein